MMKVICAGYRDKDMNIVSCGKLIRTHQKGDGVSHGICESCFKKFKQLLKLSKEAAK